MIDADDLIPDIFFTLMTQRDKANSLTPELLEEYQQIVQEQASFFPEFLTLLGPEIMIDIIKLYGGLTLNVPTPSDIISTIRKSNNGTA